MIGGDPIKAYRQYLEQTLKRDAPPDPSAQDGAGPDTGAPPDQAAIGNAPQMPADAPIGASPQGAGPAIGQGGPAVGVAAPPPSAAQAAPAAPIGSGGGPDEAPPQGMAPQAPQAPQADQAPQAKRAEKAKGARRSPQAPTLQGNTPIGGPSTQDLIDRGFGGPSYDPNQDMQDALVGGGNAPTPAADNPAAKHIIPGAKTADGKPKVAVMPPDHDPQTFFDKSKLADVHNATDLVAAIKPDKLNSYMDWWEDQHGQINQRYDAMLKDLGQRPDPNREPTRKEQFTELMNFGLHMMQGAARGKDQVENVGNALSGALATQKQKQLTDTQQFDARAGNIQGQRQDQLKDLGNYGQAVREDALIQNARTRTAIAQANANKQPKLPTPITHVDDSGKLWERDPNTGQWAVGKGVEGATFKNTPGVRGGMARDGSTALMKNYQFLTDRLGMDANTAKDIAFHQKSGDPQKDHLAVYSKMLTANGGDAGSAKETADQYITENYGANAIQGARTRGQIPLPPPTQDQVPAGKKITRTDGTKWANRGGKIVQVQ